MLFNNLQEAKAYTSDSDEDYEYKLYRKTRRRKVELVTMDIFRNTDSEISSPDEGRITDGGSSPDDLDWADSDREDVEVTYQPSYRKLNFDYVI